MKQKALFVFTALMMSWANTAYALTIGGVEVGLEQFLLLIVFHIIFLFIASKIADFEQPDFLRAVSCSLGIAAIFFFLLVLTDNSGLQSIGLIVAAIADVVLIQRVYNTTLGKTLIAFLLIAIATVVAAIVLSGAL